MPEMYCARGAHLCSYDIFEDPVVAADGNTYERSAIEAMFATGNNRSPLTNQVLANTTLTPCRQLKRMSESYRASMQLVASRKRARFEAMHPPEESVSRVLDELQGVGAVE